MKNLGVSYPDQPFSPLVNGLAGPREGAEVNLGGGWGTRGPPEKGVERDSGPRWHLSTISSRMQLPLPLCLRLAPCSAPKSGTSAPVPPASWLHGSC